MCLSADPCSGLALAPTSLGIDGQPLAKSFALLEDEVLATFIALNAAASLNAETIDVDHRRGSFKSGGKTIGVEEFIPKGGEAWPAIVVLHGAGGMDYGNSYVRQLATALAGNGYATFLVHYFDRTNNSYAND